VTQAMRRRTARLLQRSAGWRETRLQSRMHFGG
jgi:hypothetical protein